MCQCQLLRFLKVNPTSFFFLLCTRNHDTLLLKHQRKPKIAEVKAGVVLQMLVLVWQVSGAQEVCCGLCTPGHTVPYLSQHLHDSFCTCSFNGLRNAMGFLFICNHRNHLLDISLNITSRKRMCFHSGLVKCA